MPMGTVTIAGRTFEVFRLDAPGASGRMRAIAKAEAAVLKATGEEFWDRQAELVKAYFVDDKVTIEELHEILPARCSDIIKACVKASGGEVAAQGEQARP
jgi:hypothetical protein